MASVSDRSLVAAVLRGQVDAFTTLLGRYRDMHTRFAMRMLGSYDDADDALQSAFVRAFRCIGQCKDPDRFGAWLYRIVVNECRTHAMRRAIRERRFVGAAAAEAVGHAAPPAGDPALLTHIQRALDHLDPLHREAFLLKHVEELSYEEMADVTGASVSALKMRVKRACDALRAQLGGLG
jgi:RNA polymerase sigma-70 factor (ECF subfamily)